MFLACPAVLTQPPCSSSTLAFATTIHLGLVALRSHRAPGVRVSPHALVSLLFTATPWLFPSVPGVALGIAAHFAWFVACEALVWSPARARMLAPTAAAPRPPTAVSPRPPAARPAPQSFIQVPILATFDETDDMKTIRLARPEDFTFDAGQFVTVRVRVDGKEFVRCYSISSAPEVRGYFEVTVKRQGLVSNALHATARPAGMLSIRRPNGKFVYPSNDDRPIVLVAGGVGVTPLMSMLRHAVHAEPTRPITMLYSAHTPDGFAFRDELATIARRHPQAGVVLNVTRDPAPPPPIRAGRIDEELLSTVPNLLHSVAFICGPQSMIDGMRKLFGAVGLPPAQVRHEVFEAAIAASASPRGATVEPRAALPSAAAAPRAGYSMHCAISAKTVQIQPGETLLEAAEREGIDVPSLCRAGVCGTCRTRVTEGDVECTATTLDPEEQADGFVLACVATARSACCVNL